MISSFPSDAVAFVGLSTDTKPITKYLKNGSLYLEMDTGKVFIFDEEFARWLELGEETPLPAQPCKHEINWTGYYVITNNDNMMIDVSGNQTGTLNIICSNMYQLKTLEDLFNFINDNDYKLTQSISHGTEEDGDYSEDIRVVSPIVLFDNSSKLLCSNVYGEGDEWTADCLIITSFTDTVIPENN